MKEKLIQIVKKFKGQKILVIGDIMLDKYVWGDVTRISPEAPIPVLRVKKESYTAGGAGNTAANVAVLGGNTALIGSVGKDDANKILQKKFKKLGVNVKGVVASKKNTIQKVRFVGQNQQLLRVDYEDTNSDNESKLIENIKKAAKKADAIVISDYAKGVVVKKIMDAVKKAAKGKILVVDPKPKNKLLFKGATLITPNSKEAKEMTHLEDIEKIGAKLVKDLDSNVIVTRGELGMAIFQKGKGKNLIPTKAKEVFDVSGAGDTVIATLTLALAAGATIEESAVLANYAAGIAIRKIGTSTVNAAEIINDLEEE